MTKIKKQVFSHKLSISRAAFRALAEIRKTTPFGNDPEWTNQKLIEHILDLYLAKRELGCILFNNYFPTTAALSTWLKERKKQEPPA